MGSVLFSCLLTPSRWLRPRPSSESSNSLPDPSSAEKSEADIIITAEVIAADVIAAEVLHRISELVAASSVST